MSSRTLRHCAHAIVGPGQGNSEGEQTRRAILGVLAGSLVLLLALLPGSAHAATLKLRDVAGVPGTLVRGDADRYVASAAPEQDVRLLDTKTAETQDVAVPEGCAFADIHRATILWSCSDGSPSFTKGRTLDIHTKRTAELPTFPNRSVDGATYVAIGARWAVVRVSGYHYAYDVFLDRNTGRFVRPTERLDRLADLDRSPLTRQLCTGQQRPTVPNDVFVGVEPGPLSVAGPWAAATSYADQAETYGRVLLQRCGGAPRTLRRCKNVGCSQPVITPKWVAWTENTRGQGRLVVRWLASGRTRRTTPRYGSTMTPLLVGNRLYVLYGKRLLQASL